MTERAYDFAALTFAIAAFWMLIALWIPRPGGFRVDLLWIFKILIPLSAILSFGLMYFGAI